MVKELLFFFCPVVMPSLRNLLLSFSYAILSNKFLSYVWPFPLWEFGILSHFHLYIFKL